MCGIFFVAGLGEKPVNAQRCIDAAQTIVPRGPDHTSLLYDKSTFMGFQRLKVNDLTDAGNQPMYLDDVYLLCNGEIYNCKELNDTYGLSCVSHSDCETVLRLYVKLKQSHGIKYATETLPDLLDGEFAFVIYDKAENVVHICRDPYGVRPLFYYHVHDELGVASELKGVHTLNASACQFPPGTIKTVDLVTHVTHDFEYVNFMPTYGDAMEEDILPQIRTAFTNAVTKRLMSDRPVCALLSGGLDSSLVASIAARAIAPNKLSTFSIGIEGSTDLVYAKKVADFIGSEHHVIELQEQDFLNAIEETIKTIESYDITTVRASVGNYLIAKYIANNTDFKVVYNGDYSDEVCGGYMYFKNAPSERDFHEESCRLVKDICFFDSLRSDRTISSQGLEARVPFSDKEFVRLYLSIPASLRMSKERIEKYMLRKAFAEEALLPEEVLWRKKEAFSDGVSHPERSWHRILQTFIDTKVKDDEFVKNKDQYEHNPPLTKEAYYYRKVFEQYYPQSSHVIPYFWLPKWSGNVMDPSARELQVYSQN